jgi:hypothetical protein
VVDCDHYKAMTANLSRVYSERRGGKAANVLTDLTGAKYSIVKSRAAGSSMPAPFVV